MERSTIRLEVNLIDKIKEIQGLMGYKSVNETVKHLLPKGTCTPEEYVQEQPAFVVDGINVSWNKLRTSEVNSKWGEEEVATLIFKDDAGVLIRFEDKQYNEVYLNYFHFL